MPTLFLSACGADDDLSVEENETQTSSQEDAEAVTRAPDDAEESTQAPQANATQESSDSEAEGGAEGAAAAGRTKEFIVALVNADPTICEYILDFQSEGPMSNSAEDMERCKQVLPSTLEGKVGEEEAAIIDVIEVNGADVNGDTAIVDSDNFSDLFAQGFGNQEIGLTKVEGQWYIDLNNSFQSPDSQETTPEEG